MGMSHAVRQGQSSRTAAARVPASGDCRSSRICPSTAHCRTAGPPGGAEFSFLAKMGPPFEKRRPVRSRAWDHSLFAARQAQEMAVSVPADLSVLDCRFDGAERLAGVRAVAKLTPLGRSSDLRKDAVHGLRVVLEQTQLAD